MITIDCPVCGNDFRDYQGENAVLNESGEMIDYDRYYQCPHCGSYLDIQTQKRVTYEEIKNNVSSD